MRPPEAALASGDPRTAVRVQLSAVALALCEQQLRDASRLVEYFMAAINAPTSAALEVTLELPDGKILPLSPAVGAPGLVRTGSLAPAARWQSALSRVLAERKRLSGWRLPPGTTHEHRAPRGMLLHLSARCSPALTP